MNKQKGFTLIELLVGIFVLGGLGLIFVSLFVVGHCIGKAW